jgi:hypothetical protein
MTGIDAERFEGRGVSGIRSNHDTSGVEVFALALQEARLRTILAIEDPYRRLDGEYARIDEVRQVAGVLGMTDQEVKSAIVALYREFVQEVGVFLRANVLSFPRSVKRAVAS